MKPELVGHLDKVRTTHVCAFGRRRRIIVEFLENYWYAQVFAPKGKEFVALEPMTAPTSALTSGQGLPIVEAGT